MCMWSVVGVHFVRVRRVFVVYSVYIQSVCGAHLAAYSGATLGERTESAWAGTLACSARRANKPGKNNNRLKNNLTSLSWAVPVL